ncbi:Midasin [Rhynchospora pubera]|uniref:Midasin n=1 Tax=Rhynchospora pubera TaxID=906938 RepID=A0AAV8E6Z8_9POAL|nr:Midasin [Rhynchospora pubera]
MSLDGSFSPSASLRRLLARCPPLRSDPKLSSLERNREGFSESALDDLVEALADPFLHPEYTIPIVGCFRPICERIATRAIEKLRTVSSLNSENNASSEDVGEEEPRVLDFYLRRGRGLRLHEIACLALCRALDLAPFLLRCILNYFKFSPPPFARLLFMDVSLPEGIKLLLEATRLSYRFLAMEPKVFSELWDWSCFLDLLQSLGDLTLTETIQLDEKLDLRWCTAQILSIVLKSSDRIIENIGLRADEAFMCYNRWRKLCSDTSIEKAGVYFEGRESGSSDTIEGITTCSPEMESLNSCIVDSLSEMKVSEPGKRKKSGDLCPFKLTTSMKKAFEVAMMNVTQKWPVLLYGPVGAGKTALINKLATGSRVLFIHMDEQMDSRTLVGSYVCTEKPGEFKWNPGSLTQAIVKGYWIVFEDIDKAPSDVQSVLLPLMEGSTSFSTGHGEVVEVADSFRLFATVATSGTDIEGRRFSALWRQVMVRPPSKEDMLQIVNTWYPSLEPISSKLLDIFARINNMTSHQLCGSISTGSFIRFTLRDLLKWCKRLIGGGGHYADHALSSLDIQTIYQEAVDLFAANFFSLEKRLSVMRILSEELDLPAPDSALLIHKPTILAYQTLLQIGRAKLECIKKPVMEQRRPFVDLRSSLQALEIIACSVKYNEPVLLVGETGTGKTTLVQNLATWLGHPLTVMNLSQQSDVTDLLGGFKPTDVQSLCVPLYHEFKDLFCKINSEKANQKIFHYCEVLIIKKNWKKLLRVLQNYVDEVYKTISNIPKSKGKRPFLISEWESLTTRLKAALNQIGTEAGLLFKFVEGAFVTALRNGHWILLDEVNLAPQETLQRIGAVLDGERSTLCLAERGDVDYVDRHLSFRLFACMNPATDAGKRELPYSFRSRFTEYFVDDVLEDDDLRLFVNKYLDTLAGTEYTEKIIQFYKAAKKESEVRLQDGARQKPQFSLRSLARALHYAKKGERDFPLKKALYDGFCMFFVTLLDEPSARIMTNLIVSHILDGKIPPSVPFNEYILDRSKATDPLENYILTCSVKEHLKNLARAVYIKRYPVLLQGPTSSGKTSLVRYLASFADRKFVRINNHEHTDLQEYFGTYVTDSHGRLQFQEGVLVKAVREGHWIVLDELNLAPSDVLEALNRLLDDNRELFIPELQETIQAHPNFMLFATQNPPVLYGGRKMLSRAFRNRFIEMQVDEIPEDELITILEQRCKIAAKHARKMVEVMKELQLHRQNSRVFAGKQGFITPRDLFRWADRFRVFGKSLEDLAKDGYLLLAERLRDGNEKIVVYEALKRHLGVDLNVNDLYKWELGRGNSPHHLARDRRVQERFGNITWTRSMWRLYFLIERCYEMREPVLLVGETGGGKTTVCQLLSLTRSSKLHILNCHQYTETSDFIGGFCPIRDRSRLATEFEHHITSLKQSKLFMHATEDIAVSSNISQAPSVINIVNEILSSCKKAKKIYSDVTQEDIDAIEQVKLDLIRLHQKWQAIFLWQDGPLVMAMKAGDMFLVDEISLADDSVLERLNSVLEPERKLSLAEKGGSVLEKITADPNFFVLATMNPGGDYGKKELSPALRNRFTEIWVPAVDDIDEIESIAVKSFKPALSILAKCVVNFWKWFNELQVGRTLNIRDLLSWITFINVAEEKLGPEFALIHGVFLVLLDGLTLGSGITWDDANELRESSLCFLHEELQKVGKNISVSALANLGNYGWGSAGENISYELVHTEDLFGIKPFFICKGNFACKTEGYELLAPTTKKNVLRVLRAMQLPKPVLLEGSPGVGKTSLVVALGRFSGHDVVRINLSEQTDMMDLLGSDLPVQGENGMEFSWSDGILLQALKRGSWVLLDELNLAPQSVLEGLNSILDHRAEVFIPELGRTFKCPPSFRVFACQNPSSQGGGRKGLPKSFLNRFAKVYVDELSADDYLYICQARYPLISSSLLSKLITFNRQLHLDTMVLRKYGQEGSPWEFNLRDVIRSCQMISSSMQGSKFDFLNVVYLQRMRTLADRNEVIRLFEEVFETRPSSNPHPKLHINPKNLIVGSACIQRSHFQPSKTWINQLEILPGALYSMEAIMHCLNQRWLCILVGPHSSGKTSLIRLLAQLTGNTLHELNLSTGTDVSELLGCFEQYNIFRHYKAVMCQIERYLIEYFSLRSEVNWEELIAERKGLYAKWFEFTASKSYSFSMPVSALMDSWDARSFNSLPLLVDIIKQLKNDPEVLKYPVSWSVNDLDILLKSVQELQRSKSLLQQKVKFEWVAGDLVKAMERGEWVVLDNANLCNPSVLDRINSLAEPDGSLVINECGLAEGKPVILHAHPQFRMFLTVNPRFGEVSRAMRNRGVEIFLLEKDGILVDDQIQNHEDSCKIDVARFLVSSGIMRWELVSAMTDAHMFAKKEARSRLGVSITLLELTRWVQLFQQLLLKGNQLMWSLQLSWEHTYLPSLGEIEGISVVLEGKSNFLSGLASSHLDFFSGYTLSLPVGQGKSKFSTGFASGHSNLLLRYSPSLPGGWPLPLKLRDFVWYSREACVTKNCMYLETLGAQCAAYELSRCCSGMEDAVWKNGNINLSVMPVSFIHQLLFPGQKSVESENILSGYDAGLANQMLFFAANWVIEQVTDRDLYVKQFRLYSSEFQKFCNFFRSFDMIFEGKHSRQIWDHIFQYYREVVSHFEIDTNVYPLPFLSSKLLELASSDNALKSCHTSFGIALVSIKLFLLSRQQWNTEKYFTDKKRVDSFLQLLKSIRKLEKKMLAEIAEQELCDIFSNIIEYHRVFWNSLASSHSEYATLAWNLLEKEVTKLKPRFPVETNGVLDQRLKLKSLRVLNIGMQKPTLWSKGGHPFIPSSGDVFEKVRGILTFVDDHWPRKRLLKQNFTGNCSLVDAILSTDVELKWLAVDGICMSEVIVSKSDEDDSKILSQLEEIDQSLVRRVKTERKNLESIFEPGKEINICRTGASNCCLTSSAVSTRRDNFLSWQATLPLLDLKSANLNISFLPKLVEASWLDSTKSFQHISETSKLVEYALNYSSEFSSKSPVELAPLRIILWIQERQSSVDSLCTRIATATMQIWHSYHSFLWNCFSGPLKGFYDEPCHLTHLSKTAALATILQDTVSIRDYNMCCQKLRIVLRNLWEDPILPGGLVGILHSAADHLLKQIFFVNKKHFHDETFDQLKSILVQLSENGLKVENLASLQSLISESTHDGLSSLWNKAIEPLLKELYTKSPATEMLYNLGCAWFHIGEVRYELLLSSYGLDPVIKYAFKHSHVLEKISLVELDMKVRHECELLAGCNMEDYHQDGRQVLLQKLGAEEKKLRAKVVFRPQPSKFKELMKACVEFKDLMSICSSVVVDDLTGTENLQLTVDKACSWQITSANFIERLSEEFSEYVDLIQPIQVAIYEMKLGLSAALSGALERQYLKMAKQENTDEIFDAISSFVAFPARTAPGQFPVSELLVVDPVVTKCTQADSTNVVKGLIAISNETDSAMEVLNATINHVTLVRNADQVFSSLVLDKTSFVVMHDMFNQFNDLWFEMKRSKLENEDDDEERLVKFKPRLIKLEDVMEGDVSSLLEPDADQDFMFKNEIEERTEQEFINSAENATKLDGVSEEVWENISESKLNDIVRVHNQLFGSEDLIEQVGRCHITNEQKLQCFTDSYDIGTRIIKDLQSLTSSKLDGNLTPEHLLHVCLEFDSVFSKKDVLYNAYKDPNAFVLSKMVDPLNIIQDRVNTYLIDWPEHPVLQRILKITETLLSMPLSSPLSKALQGLQLLIGRIQSLQETDMRFPFKEQLPPLYVLVSSWQKLELESWHPMVCRVQEKHDASAGRLWFPLRAVLQKDLGSTIKSIEDFIQSSTIGEYKRRLQLLLALHGELSRCISWDILSSSKMNEKLDVLYNAFGYYVQFAPLILERIESERRSLEKELKENVKLYHWEPNVYSIERFKKTRQKAFKLIQKFNEFLQQPVMTFLNKRVAEAASKAPSWLDQNEPEKINGELPKFPVDLCNLRNADRFLWYDGWISKAGSIFQSMDESLLLKVGVKQEWDNCWASLEGISINTAELGHVLKSGTKNRKKRAFTNLLKTLEASGLSKHRSVNTALGQASSSYEIEHLLLHQPGKEAHKGVSLASTKPSRDEHQSEWKSANQCYFKCLAMIQQFFQSCLKFHKDLDLEQVNRAKSFMDHLMDVLSKQRHSAYGLFWKLGGLRDQVLLLEISGGLSTKQKAVMKCMWQQKRLFDSLLALSRDTNILLGLFGKCHLSNCKEVGEEFAAFSSLIKDLQPGFMQCKEWLDDYLIGGTTAISSCVKRMPLGTKDMEKKLESNMQKVCNFGEQIEGLAFKVGPMRFVMHKLISRFRELINEGKKIGEGFQKASCAQKPAPNFSNRTFEEIIKLVRDAFLKLMEPGKVLTQDEELAPGNIALWNNLLDSATNLQLDQICDSADRVITETRNMVELDPSKPDACSSVEVHLKGVYQHLGIVLAFCDGMLSEFIDAHKMMCEMTNDLGEVLMLLFTEGFGSAEESTETDGTAGTEDVKGTGMGEGEGAKDVSDKIEDESQIVGTEEKQDGPDKSDKQPSGKDEGIEMEEDFSGDMCSVSDDSGGEDEDEDDEEPNIESQMGDAGENKEAVSEKAWDGKNDDENPESSSEKYESGSSIKETDPSAKELRAKDDESLGVDDSEKFDDEEAPEETKEENQTGIEDEKDPDGMEMEKSEAFEDSTGAHFQEAEKDTEDAEMDDAENAEAMDDGTEQDGVDDEELEKDGEGEEKSGSPDDMEQDEVTTEENKEGDITGAEHGKDESNMESKEDIDKSDNVESAPYPLQSMPMRNFDGFDPNLQPEANWANTNDVSSSLAPGNDAAKLEISIPDSIYGSRLSSDSKTEGSERDAPIDRQMQKTNPFRSITDALQEWKERATVSADQDQAEPGSDDINDMDADEYMYVAEGQKSTSQALGAATSDQMKNDVDEDTGPTTDENNVKKREEATRIDMVENPENVPSLRACKSLVPRDETSEGTVEKAVDMDTPMEEAPSGDSNLQSSQDVVLFNRSYMDEKVATPEELLMIEDSPSDEGRMDSLNDGDMENAVVEWKRHEISTMRLSQELAEQLRLVMEPTLASKLQGDYRTGKRINMKKVIPYIASHFRKDKIWLRRTKPNKRNYQVVVAVDDSRSMSESQCGKVAIEALVTVCRAMSQLEVGQFAVASFGEKGKIKLLHDFDQTFTTEAGIKMISSFSFKQDNTIADEPVVDLLKYLNGMLDMAVLRSRMPSGQNPLHQLVLIIADGRFHEKENLRRCVRDVLSQKRMVAFILLDSPQESIMDMMEATFEGDKLSFKRYLNSFPFPYYIVLKNIEVLPRTLADLLRQWFELMQSLNDN